MVKNQGKGGKKFKRSKNTESIDKRQLLVKEEGQEYAYIVKMLGNNRCECKCNDGRSRLGIIRGSMIRRVWICLNDLVLVSLREYQDEKADIIHKYTADEEKTLRSYGEISIINQSDLDNNMNNDTLESNICFDENDIDLSDI